MQMPQKPVATLQPHLGQQKKLLACGDIAQDLLETDTPNGDEQGMEHDH